MTLDNIEIRNWALFTFALIGIFVTLKTFFDNIKQRKLDNTFKTLDYLRRHITKDQTDTFIKLFQANNELSGVKYNEFRFPDGRTDTIETMFSEGGCGNGDIHNMIEVFNLIAKSMRKKLLVDDLIWYEYGQIMFKCYDWTKYIEDNHDKIFRLERKSGMTDDDYKKFKKYWDDQKDILMFYKDFNDYVGQSKAFGKPTKVYVYLE